MPIKKVALLGADGNLGPAMLSALLKANFTVTVIKRKSSTSPDTYPAPVSIKRVPDDLPTDALASALTDQDAVVVTIKGSQTDVQKRLGDACILAGIQRFIPADFGSCDSSSPLTQDLVPLYKRKTELREYLQQLASSNPKFTWTSLVCGHFFDWSLEFIHIFLRERRADILDDGRTKCSFSTLARIAEAAVRVLQRPEETANQMLYVQSFCVTQRHIVAAYEKATGAAWEVWSLDAEKFRDEEKRKADAGSTAANEELVWYLGTVDADWTTREAFAMKSLGLEDESLDDAVAKVVREQS